MAATTELLTLQPSGTSANTIKVVATATPGTAVHRCSSSTSDIDEIEIKACNNHTAAVDLTIEFGGQTDPDNCIKYFGLPVKAGETVIVSYSPIKGAVSPKDVTAFASVANVVILTGRVLRTTQT